ncbi:substrate-binding domain-containing protein [Streptomyces sp. NPDC102451]|uniref:substrate-binding domain-containing protein n=1 Tax=Streptomyces sp. NPDC102451 TaxID=3366177 RepID=UPI003825D9BA
MPSTPQAPAWSCADGPYDDTLVLWGGSTRAGGTALMHRALRAGLRHSANFAGNDLAAAGALPVLRKAGIRVPEDVSIASYDGLSLAVDLHPALTSVHLPHEEIGRTAVRVAPPHPPGRFGP